MCLGQILCGDQEGCGYQIAEKDRVDGSKFFLKKVRSLRDMNGCWGLSVWWVQVWAVAWFSTLSSKRALGTLHLRFIIGTARERPEQRASSSISTLRFEDVINLKCIKYRIVAKSWAIMTQKINKEKIEGISCSLYTSSLPCRHVVWSLTCI